MLTANRLREILAYSPETGEFRWAKPLSPKHKVGEKAGYLRAGYWSIGIDRKCYLAHRLAWLYVYDAWPVAEIDHINGDRFDNRLSNLRSVSRSANMKNSPISRANSSGAIGVYLHRPTNRWYAQSCQGGKNKHLGSFDTFEEAALARKVFQDQHGYHPNHGRSAPVTELKGDGQ